MASPKKEYIELCNAEKSRIEELLKSAQAHKVELDELHVVYVVSPSLMQRIEKMREAFANTLGQRDLLEKERDPYYHVAKLINPDFAATYWNFRKKKKYIYVKKRESILNAMQKRMEIWANTKRKLAKEACKEKGEDFCKKALEETEVQIQKERQKVAFIQEHFDELDVLWTNYTHAKEYYIIYYRNNDRRYRYEHVRKGLPNILQYVHEEERSRRDMQVEKFIQEAECALDEFYYKPRNNDDSESL